jgi:hypothetical protein
VTAVAEIFKISSLMSIASPTDPLLITGFITSNSSSNLNSRDKIDLSLIDAIPGGGDNAFLFSTAPPNPSNAGWAGKIWVTSAGDGALINISMDADSSPEYQIKLIGVNPVNISSADFVL